MILGKILWKRSRSFERKSFDRILQWIPQEKILHSENPLWKSCKKTQLKKPSKKILPKNPFKNPFKKSFQKILKKDPSVQIFQKNPLKKILQKNISKKSFKKDPSIKILSQKILLKDPSKKFFKKTSQCDKKPYTFKVSRTNKTQYQVTYVLYVHFYPVPHIF